MSKINLGRVGLWTADLDLQPMVKAQEAIAQAEEMGFGTVWVPEAVLREPFASTSLLLSATKKMILATGIASIHARTAQTMQAGWKTVTEAFPDRFVLGMGVSHAPMVNGCWYFLFASSEHATTARSCRAGAKDVEACCGTMRWGPSIFHSC